MIAPFQLLLSARILFGRGEAAKAAGLAAGFSHHAFVVHGRDAARAGWLINDLQFAGVEVTAFACPKEPDLPLLEAALAAARRCGAGVVLGLGGGAAIDLAKAVAGLAPGQGAAMDHLEGVGRALPLTASPLPFIALPTTAGTGSEATKNAVIDVPEHRRKVSLRDDRMLARVAIVDPALTDGCPREVTLASGLDALTQVIEPYLCSRPNPATDALALAAIPQGAAALIRLMDGEDPAARDAMAWVSLAGGIALANAGLGAVHALAGVIGGVTGAAHGAICGTLLPFVLQANARALQPGHPALARIDEVERLLSSAFGPGRGSTALHDWSRKAGLPGLDALGLDPGDHLSIAEAARAASSMKANPAALGTEDLCAVLALAR
ncbi:MAG: iron-containing alcohol dehydrogenase [Rhodobacterales bacterium]|nr:iron-containing alcohol dehydrogenase [Rhodobacterales bacterium]